MTHAKLETRIGETKTLREWIAELDLHPTTLNAGTTDETYAYAVCTEDRTYQEYIVVSDYRGRSLTAESEEMYLDAEFELDGMGGYSLEETAASFFLQEKLIARPCFYRESIQDDRKPAIYLEGTDDLGTEVHISLSAYMPKTENEWSDIWNEGFTPSEEAVADLIFADDDQAEELAEAIREAGDWSECQGEVKRLCELAGLLDEYNEADGDSFECVIDRAAEFFGVTVIATVAEALKSLRKRTGLSQTAFGEVCGGIPLRTIQNWESGIRECPDYVLFLIKSHLKSKNLI